MAMYRYRLILRGTNLWQKIRDLRDPKAWLALFIRYVNTTNSGTFDHPGSKTCSGHVQYMFMTRSKQCQNTFVQDAFFNHFNIFSYFEVYHLFKILIIFILPLFSYYFLLKEPYCGLILYEKTNPIIELILSD